jgi:hypothetical protein
MNAGPFTVQLKRAPKRTRAIPASAPALNARGEIEKCDTIGAAGGADGMVTVVVVVVVVVAVVVVPVGLEAGRYEIASAGPVSLEVMAGFSVTGDR